MNKRLLTLITLFSSLLAMNYTHAAVTGASVTPTQRQLAATGINTFNASWSVYTDNTHRAGTTSGTATLYNAANGMTLGTVGSPFSTTGGGPFTFNETISINSSQVSSWQNQGINEVWLQRTFNDPGSSATATAFVRLLVPTTGQLVAARVSPSRSQLLASENNVFSASWYIATGSGHVNGVTSNTARLISPGTGTTLATLGGTLSANGNGPFTFTENIQLDAALVRSLINQRLVRVVLQRTFIDPVGGGSVEASMTLVLNKSPLTAPRELNTGSLSIRGMRLEFSSGNDLTSVDLNDSLHAKLTLTHSGTGLLEGRWQLAEPGSTENIPLYRTLALVRRNITGTQRSILRSPELPTSRTGKYLLRFCITNREMVTDDHPATVQCPIARLVANAAYQTQGDSALDLTTIRILSPDRQNADSTTAFSWQPVADAKVYQMQIFTLVPEKGSLQNIQENEVTMEPRFIVGMVLPAETTMTLLSELVRSKLQTNHRYLWRITAHDEAGRMIGRSPDAGFVFTLQDNAL